MWKGRRLNEAGVVRTSSWPRRWLARGVWSVGAGCGGRPTMHDGDWPSVASKTPSRQSLDSANKQTNMFSETAVLIFLTKWIMFCFFYLRAVNYESQIQQSYTIGFSYARPKAWNDLPFALQELTDACTFKRQLKTHLLIHWHILTARIYNFVEAPLVTLSVNCLWNNDNVM